MGRAAIKSAKEIPATCSHCGKVLPTGTMQHGYSTLWGRTAVWTDPDLHLQHAKASKDPTRCYAARAIFDVTDVPGHYVN